MAKNKKPKNRRFFKPHSKKKKLVDKLPLVITELLDQRPDKAYTARKLCKELQLHDRKTKRKVIDMLKIMAKQGMIGEAGPSLYTTKKPLKSMEGVVDFVNPKFAYVIVEGLDRDIWVRKDDLGNALDGDTVKIALHSGRRKGRRPEGYVTEIVKRGRTEFVGRIELSPRYAFVVTDNRKMYNDVFVPLDKISGADHLDKVIVRITDWPARDKNPKGEISRVLGKSGLNETEIHAIMAEFDLPFEFDESVEAEAKKIPQTIPAAEIARRRDMRDVPTFTIDPHDAKDFDDAISFRKLNNGNFEIGVHIADVTHYVRPGSKLEDEAYSRGTSVYLVDRTIPMLPERLSNGLCSLRPNEDKLTFSAVFELNGNGKIEREWFGRTVTHSDRRFTYEEAQERIETQQGDYAHEICTLNDMALKLRVKRFAQGSINFETTEVKFRLDENGKPLEVIPKVRKDAHKLVEDFMLLANKRVAEFVYGLRKGKRKDTFVYRIHGYPDPDRLADFSKFAQRFGHRIDPDEENVSQSFNQLLNDIEGKPEQNVLETLAIRSMAKARYSTEPEIHFGLAFKHYSHFTSPIRRYPDMMVHRLLQHYLDGGPSVDADEFESFCKHCSEREKIAADADRASTKYKQVEYMESLESRDWEGIVSGVTEWGIFVEITETHCEGMVRLANMTDDFYEFDEENYRVIGNHSKRIIALGDNVTVRVVHTDINKRTIDLEFV